MKTLTTPTHPRVRPGLTLIELTVVIVVVMAFLSMIFIGVRSWKRGSDRANCVLNIRHLQMAVRGYANSRQLNPGEDTALLSPPVNLTNTMIGPGKFVEGQPICPGNGLYTMGGNVIPLMGSLYMTCSLETVEGHIPDEYATW